MFPVLFTIPRAVGWLAHWLEFLQDSENKIVRPRQVYVGQTTRHYVPPRERSDAAFPTQPIYSSIYNIRRNASNVN